MADYDQAIQRNARMVPAYAGRARTRYAKADLDGAIADYDQALRINPKAVAFYIDRGNVRRRKGDVEHAIADFAEAIRVDPTFAGAFISRGLALESRGDREHARADYQAVLALPPRGDPGKRIQDSARARLANLAAAEQAAPAAIRASTPQLNSVVTAMAPATRSSLIS